jgi:polar amino acid transport system permease protein
MDPVWDWFLWLKEAHGIKLTIFYDEWDRGRFFSGIWTTIHLSFICVVAEHHDRDDRGVATDVQSGLGSPDREWLHRLFSKYATAGATLLLLFCSRWNAVECPGGQWRTAFSSYGWAVVSLSFFAGAFNVEIFRAGVESVPKATTEAAESLGYTNLQIYRYVTLPLAYRVCLPALNNNLVNLVKTTTVAYAIAVPETLYVSAQIWSDEYNVFEMMNVVWIVYLLLVGLLVWLMHRWERSIQRPGFGKTA